MELNKTQEHINGIVPEEVCYSKPCFLDQYIDLVVIAFINLGHCGARKNQLFERVCTNCLWHVF
jgi:hypothetical protein